MAKDRFHGRVGSSGTTCQWPDCEEPGEFRAPGATLANFDGPGQSRWFCLDHVRDFNAGYDWFAGMTPEDILRAQSPLAGWETQSRAFRPDANVDQAPRWADFADPLDAISMRAGRFRKTAAATAQNTAATNRFTPEERRAFEVMGLAPDTNRAMLRQRYSHLVQRYHPDRNGGDRRHEARLQQVVAAYQLLRRHGVFS